MAALAHPLDLSLEAEAERVHHLLLRDVCRFCQCTEDSPCAIALVIEASGIVRLARNEDEVTDIVPCSWYVSHVCNSPTCIEKLLIEAREKVMLFGADGRRAG